jgi:four helix bundle protein
MLLTRRIYELTQKFSPEEKFGLISQMRRAAVSIPSNVAEGHARRTAKEFAQFLSHAEGSIAELDTQLGLSVGLGSCSKEEARVAWSLVFELQKMMGSLRNSVERSLGH